MKGTPLMRTLSAAPSTQSRVQIYLWLRDTSQYRTASWFTMISTLERFHCSYMNAIRITKSAMCVQTWIQSPLQALMKKNPLGVTSLYLRCTTGRVCPEHVSGTCRTGAAIFWSGCLRNRQQWENKFGAPGSSRDERRTSQGVQNGDKLWRFMA